MRFGLRQKCVLHRHQGGFTLVELIVVMAITGILGGMIAMLIKGPVQGYVDSARRADMNDIADIALSRITRDLRMALPNSMRVWGAIHGSGSCDGTEICYLEYLGMVAGGRYITDASSSSCFSTASMVNPGVSCLTTVGDFGSVSAVLAMLSTASAVVGPTAGVYNGTGIATITSISAVAADINVIGFSTTSFSPLSGNRFQIINTPVTYVCSPVAGGAGGTLTRYWGYSIQPVQPTTNVASLGGVSQALLATNVSNCSFHLSDVTEASGQSAVLVSMPFAITEQGTAEQVGETLSFYGAAHVANAP